MRIMHVVNFFDPRLGYSEYYLAKKQAEMGFDVCVVSSDYSLLDNEKLFPGLKKLSNIDVFNIKSICKFRGNVLVFNPLTLKNLVENFYPDCIHCHDLVSPFTFQVLMLKRYYCYKVFCDTMTGISPLTSIFLVTFRQFFKFMTIKIIDKLFVNNRAVEEFLVSSLKIPSSKIQFIPLGADSELFKPDPIQRDNTRKLLGLRPDDVVVIYTGKFLPDKRINDLLLASKSIIQEKKNFKVLLVGYGPLSYTKRLKLFIKELGIENNVLIHKAVHREALPSFFNAADIAVWPGSFSISIVEAMACNLPIAIAKSDWTSHYLEYENGYSFKVGDIDGLRSILLKLVNDPELRKTMGTRSRKLVEDKLNWNVIAMAYINAYRN